MDNIIDLLIEYGEYCNNTVVTVFPSGCVAPTQPTFPGFIHWLSKKKAGNL